jgi:hypothetical protein
LFSFIMSFIHCPPSQALLSLGYLCSSDIFALINYVGFATWVSYNLFRFCFMNTFKRFPLDLLFCVCHGWGGNTQSGTGLSRCLTDFYKYLEFFVKKSFYRSIWFSPSYI